MDGRHRRHRRFRSRDLPAPTSGSKGRKKTSSSRKKKSGIHSKNGSQQTHKTGALWLAPVFLLIATVTVLCVACVPYIDLAVSAFKVYLNDNSSQIVQSDPGKYPTFGTEFATVKIPALNLIYPVLQGDTEDLLSKGVCHFYGSDLPGENSTILLTAHRTTHFSGIGALKPGENIIVETTWGTYEYVMDEALVVSAADLAGLLNANEEMLYLVTCYPFDFIGGAPERYIVKCHLVSGPPHRFGEEDASE